MEVVIEKYQMEDFVNILLLNEYSTKIIPDVSKNKIKIIVEKEQKNNEKN